MVIHFFPWSRMSELVLLVTLLSVMAVLTYFLKRARPVPWLVLFLIGAITLLASFSTVWLLWGRYIPKEHAVLFESPIPNTHCIRIVPSPYFSLVNNEMVITNSSTIKDIMLAIRSAKPFYPQHPAVHWQCYLVVSNESGDISFKVYDTPDQGTILYCVENTFSSDNMRDILEKTVAQNK